MEGKMEKCERCNIFVPAKAYEKHLQEKRHRIREKRYNEMMQNSVFISCLPRGVHEGILTEVLSSFGKVRSCSIFPRSTNAVAEFEQREAATKCLQGPVYMGQTLLKTAPRKEPKPKALPAPMPNCDVDPKELISILGEAYSKGVTDMDALIDLAVQTVRLKDPDRGRKLFMLQRDLEECISEWIPGCHAHQFGSAVTGVPLTGSDADIVMILPEAAARSFDAPQIVRRFRKLLWSRLRKFGSIVAIPEARIPIVKLVHIPTGIACDVSFQGIGCVHKSKKLSYVLDKDLRIRPLIIFLKYWSKCHNIISLSRLSSYAATLMVVFVLQQLPEPILPPIRKILHPDPGEPYMTTRNKDPLSKLVEEFFRYYSETDLTNQVICPWVGRLVPCEAFSAASKTTLPDDVEYVRNHSSSLEINTRLVVQDPYELNRNVTERVKEKDFVFFRLCWAEALEVLRKGDPTFLFKDLCVPSEVEEYTTLSSEFYLKQDYLGTVDVADESARQVLFTRWTYAVVALLPEFLSRFVRLKVESADDTRGPVSLGNSLDSGVTTECLPRSWKCSGKPVLHTWTMRRKAATRLNLNTNMPMMERETLISQHLEQQPSEVENVSFIVRVVAASKKESVRCCVISQTTETSLYQLVARKLLSLIPLWLRDAIVSRTALNYLSGFSLPTNTKTDSVLPVDTNVCSNTEESFAAEIVVEESNTYRQVDDLSSSSSLQNPMNYLSGVSLPTNTKTDSVLPVDTNVCSNTEESSAAEIVVEESNTDRQVDDLSSSSSLQNPMNYLSGFSLPTNTKTDSVLPVDTNVCSNTEESSAAEMVVEESNTDRQVDLSSSSSLQNPIPSS